MWSLSGKKGREVLGYLWCGNMYIFTKHYTKTLTQGIRKGTKNEHSIYSCNTCQLKLMVLYVTSIHNTCCGTRHRSLLAKMTTGPQAKQPPWCWNNKLQQLLVIIYYTNTNCEGRKTNHRVDKQVQGYEKDKLPFSILLDEGLPSS